MLVKKILLFIQIIENLISFSRIDNIGVIFDNKLKSVSLRGIKDDTSATVTRY